MDFVENRSAQNKFRTRGDGRFRCESKREVPRGNCPAAYLARHRSFLGDRRNAVRSGVAAPRPPVVLQSEVAPLHWRVKSSSTRDPNSSTRLPVAPSQLLVRRDQLRRPHACRSKQPCAQYSAYGPEVNGNDAFAEGRIDGDAKALLAGRGGESPRMGHTHTHAASHDIACRGAST